MIELYAKGTTDFTKHGIALAADQAAVTYQDNGRFDMDMTMPYNEQITIDYGMILRCPVPKQVIGEITLGTVSYWEISEGLTDVPLYSKIPTLRKISYGQWQYSEASSTQALYSPGAKVTYLGNNYQCTAYDPTSPLVQVPPPSNTGWWTPIPNTTGDAGKVENTLNAGDTIVKTGDFNDQYMKAADTAGHEGFIEISKCTDMSETETRTVPEQTIEKQSFTITEITKSSDGKRITLHAEHISYQLGRVMLGDCNISRATPATALMFIRGAMQEDYPGTIETNLTEELITGDYSWKNAQAAILDPKSGLLQATNGRIIRNDLDVYIIADENTDPVYRITYGTNMKAVKWDGNIAELVTRVYPIAQTEDGNTLLLPEKYIDSVRTVPYVRPESLNTGLKVGQKEKQEDGSEIELDEDTVLARMREAANNRFTIDECDKAVVTLDIDWQHLPDTAEYRQYAGLANAAPGEWVLVKNTPLGIDTTIQMTGYTFDPILERYTKGTFGKKKTTPTVAGYSIQSGAVGSRALGVGAVSGQNIQANAITAREIEANSITADRIASRSITTEILAANAVTADEINAGSVTAAKIAAGAITAVHISAGAIEAEAIGAGVIQAGHIASEAITTQKIAAGAVEASKIAALAITTEKLAAGAVTADKIGAGSITAGKISTDDLAAIQATLQIANIASATIASADINYAQVKDLNAQSAYFGQAVIQEGLANKLYIPRLAANYAQIVNATISDLVIQATDDNFYKLDVGLDGNVSATRITPSQQEIEDGHTADGRTIYMGTDIIAQDLNTMNIYASHALMDEITANIINVDKLMAREGVINWLQVQDLSSNTYIQSTVGNWASQSTITQTINGINTRISSLGYGTFFYSTTPPDPSGVVVGDVWVEPIEDNTWDDISQYTWDELGGMTWEQVAGQYRMYVWTGTEWKLLFDNMIVSQLQTQINQNAYAITLKANQSAVDVLSGEVSDFAATLEVQAQAITAAVSAVNAKTANYVQLTDPQLDSGVTLSRGDTWTRSVGNNWNSVGEYTWDELADLTWDEIAGAAVYVWDGSAWIQTDSYGAIVNNRTQIEETALEITLLAEEQLTMGDQVSRNTAQISITATQITQEVQRATNAENGKIDKTAQYQTADSIVTEAVSQAASSARGLYLAKTSTYQTAESIVTEAVRQSYNAAEGSYLKKTSTYQTAESIVSAAQSYTNGQLTSYSTTTQTSTMISQYVTDNAYRIQSGIAIEAAGVTISGGKYVNIQSTGTFSVTAATFGIRSASNETYAIWAGNGTAAQAPFRVKPDGTVYLTKLIAVGENGTETEVNLRIAGLWKLNYNTVKSFTTDSQGYCSGMSFSNGASVNFKSALSGYGEGWDAAYAMMDFSGSGRYLTVKYPSSQVDTQTYQDFYLSVDNAYAYIIAPGGAIASIENPAYGNAWTNAYNSFANSMSGSTLTITVPSSAPDTTRDITYSVAGLTPYSRAGQIAYQYSGGSLVSFTIPADCKTGNPYITRN